MRGQGGVWSLVCRLWAPGDPQFELSLPVACGALPRVTFEFPSYSWELEMESESYIEVKKKRKNPEVAQDPKPMGTPSQSTSAHGTGLGSKNNPVTDNFNKPCTSRQNTIKHFPESGDDHDCHFCHWCHLCHICRRRTVIDPFESSRKKFPIFIKYPYTDPFHIAVDQSIDWSVLPSSRHKEYGDLLVRLQRSPKCNYSLNEIVQMAERIPQHHKIYARKHFVMRCYSHGVDPKDWDWSRYDDSPPPPPPPPQWRPPSDPTWWSADHKERPPHPECKHSKKELEIIAEKLPTPQLRHKFVMDAYYGGMVPDLLLKTMLMPTAKNLLGRFGVKATEPKPRRPHGSVTANGPPLDQRLAVQDPTLSPVNRISSHSLSELLEEAFFPEPFQTKSDQNAETVASKRRYVGEDAADHDAGWEMFLMEHCKAHQENIGGTSRGSPDTASGPPIKDTYAESRTTKVIGLVEEPDADIKPVVSQASKQEP